MVPVRLAGVCKWYQGQNRVLEQVSLELKKGDFLYVVGGSGAGKSSLLRLLATEEAPTSGTVALFGYDTLTVPAPTLRAIRKSLGYIPQNVRLIPDLSVQENVALSLSLAGRRALGADAREKIRELLEKLGLGPKRDALACTLSGGEAQRVAVGRALIREPELIIADEPTGAQDNEFIWTVMELFMKANVAGSTVVVATHDREIVRRLRRRCATIRGGKLAVEGASAVCTY